MYKIQIKDTESFLLLLSSLLRIIPSCKFIINSDGIKTRFITESKGLRGVFTSDCVVCDQAIDFCFNDLSKFFKSVSLIKNVEQVDQCEINYDGTFVTYENSVKFKLKTSKEEIIERYIAHNDITTTFEPQYSFVTSSDSIKNVLQCINIVDDTDSRIYFLKGNTGLICEIDNKRNQMSDSIGMPVCDLDKISGDILEVTQTTVDNFRAFSTLPCENINIMISKQKIIVVESKFTKQDEDDKNIANINMNLYCSVLKG